MTKSGARALSNLILVSAGVAAAYVVLKAPKLRHFAGAATRQWLGKGLPMLIASEVWQAWAESRRRSSTSGAALRPEWTGKGIDPRPKVRLLPDDPIGRQ
jgi:hypothetical protein